MPADTSREIEHGLVNNVLVWSIAAATILLILARPRRMAEAVWACSGALLLVIAGAITPGDAWSAVARGTDVYLFLTGMMLLAELARREGFFDWLAVIAIKRARGSAARLFAIVYGVGTLVTIFLSNDATAIVLTPAVLAALRKTKARPLPYLLVCAFIANAASFVLPISNPANLVVYGARMPPLATWLRSFGLASAVSIAVTFVMLRMYVGGDLPGSIEDGIEGTRLSASGKAAALGIAGAAFVLVVASAIGIDLGLPTCAVGLAALGFVATKDRSAPGAILKHISWSVLALVAGLFVLVEGINHAGALALSGGALQSAGHLPPLAGSLSAAFGVALLSNVANNLPAGLIAAGALSHGVFPNAIRSGVLIGIDLGPNLSVTGSLATILWLVALRREGEDVSFRTFLRVGLVVMPPALALAVLSAVATGR